VLGDIDTLLTGPSLHVHVERKRQVISASEASGVISQMKETEKSYKLLCHHRVGNTVCDFKQVIYAESMEPGAQSQFLEQGIYVLSRADMVLQSPKV